MDVTTERQIYFSFFMFTADLRPDDEGYTQILVDHLTALTEMGYDGFDMHIASPPADIDPQSQVDSYRRLKKAFDKHGLKDTKFTTNVGTTRSFDPTSPYEEQRKLALRYLKSRVDITAALGGESIMAGPFLYPYGVFPLTDFGEPIWSDALQDWMRPRYQAALSVFKDLAEYAYSQKVKLAIEPVKSWETPPPNMVSEVLDFLDDVKTSQCGVTLDTAQVIMESQGPKIFKDNVAQSAEKKRLYYVHISAPDRGAVHDSWIPWEIILGEIEPVYSGPYLIEVFNAIPPFDSSMRMARRRFWRQGEDDEGPKDYNAYHIAREARRELKDQIAADARRRSHARASNPNTGTVPQMIGVGMASQLPEPIKLITKQAGGIRIHTFISAYTDNNIADATHIIESNNKLVLIDGQFLKFYAIKFREYADFLADSLGKPIERLYLTHRHPDHWFGLGTAFKDVPVFALPETIEFLIKDGKTSIEDHLDKLKDQAPTPDEIVIPENPIAIPDHEPKSCIEIIDGVRYIFSKIVDTEIDFHLIIELPDINVCIVQDLIYSESHLYLTSDHDMGNWIRFLQRMLLSDYDLFLAGHGLPADKREVARNVEYLLAARRAIANGLKNDAFKQFMLQRYPARLCPGIFDIYLPRLFGGARQY
jgi:sugar phosphate isomerase/epimerase/glyoxylase-like metal-dependent hydrolase (beta-lactamase superfamily II)